ncbi:hypothetical protein HIM_06499 [Hirsutella minnesotensis 3608]|uniref:RING-type domain-containing protein n=1 Tax=Hirsutella minnesotensis 3608 TaxID=1043627 RepID=A0A0F7ZNN3_9HYPO|nr:hypothetical protein HIM_06499 [Hirsutella minnesotensis 3608]
MDPRKPSLDLEKELTCSICTELLYQPLTLLDCLHTFCGACLKEWFGFQASSAEKSPSPPIGTSIFTCPSCRSTVRDTRHNATVVTLLDMFVAAQPGKARTAAEREEMARKYQPGEQVLPKIDARELTADERRADEEDRRLLNEVRERSLQEATAGPLHPPRSRRRTGSRSADDRARHRRNQSSDGHSRTDRDGRRRSPTEDSGRHSADVVTDERRQREWSDSWPRQVEHQSSLRSLIESTQLDQRDIEKEIEELARQIQEEGLLDGLDLDNIDLERDNELSRRVTEAYRRRQRERSRQESARRANSGARLLDTADSGSRRRASSNGRADSRTRTGSRPASGHGQPEDRSRPPPSNSSALDVRDPARRARRRTSSGGRRATTPVFSASEPRPAARSQTDLSSRPQQSSDPSTPRQIFDERRSSSTPTVTATSVPPSEAAATGTSNASFADRAPQWNPASGEPPANPVEAPDQQRETPVNQRESHSTQDMTPAPLTRAARPSELAIVHSAVGNPLSSPKPPGHQRTRSHLYPEPSIACARCNKPHMEYDWHYNCAICLGGQWNICLDCYRAGKGCLYWFGFGHGAWNKWEKARQSDESLARPHQLTASRYLPPPSTPGGADGRKTLTTNDPRTRLETGTFCARCFAWTNHCFWRCDVCNEGDWGYCNNCVNQGKSCSHMLLPLTHEPPQPSQSASGRPRSPISPDRPATAAIFSGPQASSMGPFKPLTFKTRCDVCQDPISPSQVRYHCFNCTSVLVPDAPPGDYDICASCYCNLVDRGQISIENGHSGWRRCLNGHRMVVIGFVEGKVGQWRYVESDLVGGRVLRSEAFDGPEHQDQGLQIWSWRQGKDTLRRLVTADVSATAPTMTTSTSYTQAFPPDGGAGKRAYARWSWYPNAKADDELLFPKGAEVREVEDVNGDWFFGTYMGSKGLFPAPYVRLAEQSQ